jgi:hypothetical protein
VELHAMRHKLLVAQRHLGASAPQASCTLARPLRSSTSQRGPARFSDDAKDDIAQLHIEYDVVTHQLLAEQVRFLSTALSCVDTS